MSIPIRALDGHIVGVRGMSIRYDRKPWYMHYGDDLTSIVHPECEKHRITHHQREIILWGKV